MSTSFQDGILRAVRRAEIPGLLFAEDIALHLCIPAAEARAAIHDGFLGPWFTIRGEPAVLRETLRARVMQLAAQALNQDRELLG